MGQEGLWGQAAPPTLQIRMAPHTAPRCLQEGELARVVTSLSSSLPKSPHGSLPQNRPVSVTVKAAVPGQTGCPSPASTGRWQDHCRKACAVAAASLGLA